MDEMVTITKSEYNSLLQQAKRLAALEAGGVDNWQWYYDSLRDGGCFDEDD